MREQGRRHAPDGQAERVHEGQQSNGQHRDGPDGARRGRGEGPERDGPDGARRGRGEGPERDGPDGARRGRGEGPERDGPDGARRGRGEGPERDGPDGAQRGRGEGPERDGPDGARRGRGDGPGRDGPDGARRGRGDGPGRDGPDGARRGRGDGPGVMVPGVGNDDSGSCMLTSGLPSFLNALLRFDFESCYAEPITKVWRTPVIRRLSFKRLKRISVGCYLLECVLGVVLFSEASFNLLTLLTRCSKTYIEAGLGMQMPCW